AFVVGGILILIIGDNPIEAYRLLFGSAFSWPVGIGYTLFYATPLIFTGLAVLVAFRCGLLNIGAEGQLYIGAFATAWVGITFANLSPWLLIPMCFLAAMVGGGIWGAIPGVLKARFGSHEVINTIMLNFLAVALLSYFTQYHYKTPGDPIMQTVQIGPGALLGRNHPVGVIISALLFAVLQRGGIPVDAFTEHVTKDIVQVLQGTIILFVAAEALFRGPFAKFGLLKRGKV